MSETGIAAVGAIITAILGAVVAGYAQSLKTQGERLKIQDEQIKQLVARLDATDKVVDTLLANQERMKRRTNKLLIEIENLIDKEPIDREKIKEQIRKGITDDEKV